MEYVGYFLIAIIGLFVVVRLLAWPLKILIRLIINAVLGTVLLFIVNLVGIYFGFGGIGINLVTALIAGFFGVPGVIFLLIFKFIL
ncbi:pro-sigmaK processing inhibitor BofA family protein [Clostridium sp.]|jgi:inhibitor of the pro-sigma K processing machinery|uniref:pro-sigmaK processing inhibitor BofA family protein n=1 Tax=Clostridium sp. TaxID=1506 RepID=UPI002588D5B4|nr:pro-sigmaK processing inhibitor BofA family protein [Clostridium sp.]MDF2505020.1 pro-sigmaK processing inhibitor BofA [Clostridium sp.]